MLNGDEMVEAISEFVTRSFDQELHMMTLQILGMDEANWADACEYVDGTSGVQMDILRKHCNLRQIDLFEERYESYYRTRSWLTAKLLLKAADAQSYWNNLETYDALGQKQVFSL